MVVVVTVRARVLVVVMCSRRMICRLFLLRFRVRQILLDRANANLTANTLVHRVP